MILGGIPAIAVVGAVGWWLGSPLFLSTMVQEAFPLSAKAEVPANMTRGEVEGAMASLAKVNQQTSESMPGAVGARLKTGALGDADSFHKGRGQVTIYRLSDGSGLVRLEGIDVTNGPDLHVYLTPHPGPANRSDVHTPGYADLGKLKGNGGSQNYPIPDDVDVAAQRSLVIYCQPFHVIFSVAQLQ